MRIAAPVKGRLRDSSLALLDAAGMQPELRTERVLSVRCLGAPADILFVRATDIPEYVQDGGVDCGITGMDLVQEQGAEVTELLKLGFGICTLEAAVPEEAEIRTLEDLDGCRVATAFPRLTRKLLTDRGNNNMELCQISGSVEIAPRLGIADAIVDLVSSGGTLRINGLRSLGVLFRSEAVLIASSKSTERVQQLLTALRSVVQARQTRYIMFNAPRDAIPGIRELLPTNGSPSVVPLLRTDAVAIHALVPAASVWELLPQLQALGATSILLSSIDGMLA